MTEPPVRRSRHRRFQISTTPVTPARTTRMTRKPPTDRVTLKHTDQCIEDVRTYGFCEHDMLPLPRPIPPPPRFRDRHPLLHELITTLGIACVLINGVILATAYGWLGIVLIITLGLGWLIIFAGGLPTWATTDLSQVGVEARKKGWKFY